MGLLETAGADFAAWNLRWSGKDRYSPTATVEERVNEMKTARAATPAQTTSSPVMRVSAGGESCRLLAAHVESLNGFLASDSFDDPIERIADDPIDSLHPGVDQSLNEASCYCSHSSTVGYSSHDHLLVLRDRDNEGTVSICNAVTFSRKQ